MTSKCFKNCTPTKIGVTLFLRYGDDTGNGAGVKSFSLRPGVTEFVGLPVSTLQVNGVGITYNDGVVSNYRERKIIEAGCDFDQILNGKHVLEINLSDQLVSAGALQETAVAGQ